MIIEWQSGQFYQQPTYQNDSVRNWSTAAFVIAVAAGDVLYQSVYQPLYQKVFIKATK